VFEVIVTFNYNLRVAAAQAKTTQQFILKEIMAHLPTAFPLTCHAPAVKNMCGFAPDFEVMKHNYLRKTNRNYSACASGGEVSHLESMLQMFRPLITRVRHIC